ncbi:MAG: ABC transporter permease, partial [Telluria sp.]
MSMDRLNRIWPPLLVLAAIVAIWWTVVVQTDSVIFPTPLQVVTGTMELVDDGTLWEHIGASLGRVATGFLLALVCA